MYIMTFGFNLKMFIATVKRIAYDELNLGMGYIIIIVSPVFRYSF
jgi:hypothetical protein